MFVNYGDVDFFEYGVLVESDSTDTEVHIIYCVPSSDEENMFFFANCIVDTDDDWIEREDVMKFNGMNSEEFDPIRFAIGCIEYYGAENFSSPYDGYTFNREEIEEMLENMGVTW